MEQLFCDLMNMRDRLPNRVIIDCLSLSLFQTPFSISPDRLMAELGACNKAHVRTILRRLKKHNLVEYEHGIKSNPDYKFTRIGPVKNPPYSLPVKNPPYSLLYSPPNYVLLPAQRS